MSEPTPEEIKLQQQQQQLQLATQEAQMRNIAAQAGEREAKAKLLISQAGNEDTAALREMQLAGAEMRQSMEALAEQLKVDRELIQARLVIAGQKADTERFDTQAEAMTKRLSTLSKERTDLVKVAEQARVRPPKSGA